MLLPPSLNNRMNLGDLHSGTKRRPLPGRDIPPRLLSFISNCLSLDPLRRPTAEELLCLPQFNTEPLSTQVSHHLKMISVEQSRDEGPCGIVAPSPSVDQVQAPEQLVAGDFQSHRAPRITISGFQGPAQDSSDGAPAPRKKDPHFKSCTDQRVRTVSDSGPRPDNNKSGASIMFERAAKKSSRFEAEILEAGEAAAASVLYPIKLPASPDSSSKAQATPKGPKLPAITGGKQQAKTQPSQQIAGRSSSPTTGHPAPTATGSPQRGRTTLAAGQYEMCRRSLPNVVAARDGVPGVGGGQKCPSLPAAVHRLKTSSVSGRMSDP